ncbi:hypothetical protein V6R21_19040 [Limibacter armeniacum]|uniref:hypothetical protein n=1 Tax=Limibacter armeniacum TaxID=466084 RepID=UPI002FE54F09
MAIKRAYGWSDIDTEILGTVPVYIQEISYSKAQEKSNGYGRGSSPNRRGRGNKSVEVSITLGMETVVAIEDYIRGKYGEGYDLLDLEPFDIPVTYDNGERVVQDIIRDFEFTSIGRGAAQGDQFIDQEAAWCRFGH